MAGLPNFDDLPAVPNMPQGCAWGIFDKDGKKDNLGCLNKLTPSIAASAATEVRDGISVSLDWPLDALKINGSFRRAVEHKHVNLKEKVGMIGLDDELEFNTQGSSQWDGLIHFAHQPTGLFYNGFKPTPESLAASSTSETGEDWPCMSTWKKRGGLVGRGVLLDYRAYAETKGIEFSPFTGQGITIEELEAVAKFQGTEFKEGDILLVRTGFTEDLEGKSADEQMAKLGAGAMSGVLGHVDTARWVWNHHFSAVASDNIAFEHLPARGADWKPDENAVLHTYFLSLFGLNIGELWDLKELSRVCREKNRYSFLLTSAPLNISSLVGSPPNALAIF
ncbi:hypothetical protein FQN54_005291 [Arachnomyces sp. PD_36]|nr:hypothetical protein FQN54_005291 [Arachnomyces sp. PD_36]